MKKAISSLMLSLLVGVSFAQKKNEQKQTVLATITPTTTAVLKNEIDTLSYCIGLNTAMFFKSQDVNELNSELMVAAINDVLKGKEIALKEADVQRFMGAFFGKKQQEAQRKAQAEAAINKELGRKFLEENKKNNPKVVALPSGLQYLVLKEGTGEKPKADDHVTVHYHGTLIDGTVFDSSVERNQPASFGVTQVIRGWVEALQLMPTGSKWKLFIPSDLAYGDQQAGKIAPGSTLIFEVELLSKESATSVTPPNPEKTKELKTKSKK